MDRIRIRGGRPLAGAIPIGGAKNAALLAVQILAGRDETLRTRLHELKEAMAAGAKL